MEKIIKKDLRRDEKYTDVIMNVIKYMPDDVVPECTTNAIDAILWAMYAEFNLCEIGYHEQPNKYWNRFIKVFKELAYDATKAYESYDNDDELMSSGEADWFWKSEMYEYVYIQAGTIYAQWKIDKKVHAND